MRNYLAPVILVTDGPAGPGGRARAPAAPPVKERRPGQARREFPLHITSAKLEADQNAGIVTFTGQVKATYGESILYSDQLRVYFQKKPEAAKGKAPAPEAAGP